MDHYNNQEVQVPEGSASKPPRGSGAHHTQAGNIELPKGGGAIRGISEKFNANPVTGSASLSLPIPIAEARGFQPELSLSYDSGSGNSEFGLGWSLGLGAISRKTSNKLPTYDDASDGDVYVISGLEDLVPLLKESNGDLHEVVYEIPLVGIDWEVKQYRPRTEGSYSKVERWRDSKTNRIWWRTVSASNITTVYGFHDQACVFDPGNRAKTYRWMMDFSYDDKGHVSQYCYKRENSLGVDVSEASERHRIGTEFSQIYLKKILHGIKTSRLKSNLSDQDLYEQRFFERERDFHFQTVFDYGDHSQDNASAKPDIENWPARLDPFSSYKPGFEIRNYRICRRIMLFHDFPELGDEPELVKSLHLQFSAEDSSFTFLTSAFIRGFKRNGTRLEHADLPSIELEYQTHAWNQELKSLDANSLENIPAGVDGQSYQWVDLYSEGLSGVLSAHSGALFYKQNLGGGRLATTQRVATVPTLKGFGNSWNLQDLESNGVKSLVSTNGTARGYYDFEQSSDSQQWHEFVEFKDAPNIALNDPNLKIIDLNGDGRPDLLISEESALRWYPSKGKAGYDAAEITPQPQGDAQARIIFANQAESIFTADMTGDGLSDIVRIRNGCIEYWPNKGFGQFGKKITMSNAPQFNHPDLFTAGHIRLADIDGSGTSDIIYLGKNEFRYWLNGSGNRWSDAHATINPFPDIDNLSNVSVMDVLGTGTSCIVWSTTRPLAGNPSVYYVDLMGSQKPHLLKSYKNGFGKSIHLEYTPSTQFYLQDKENGKPWVTKLHFPVHCLSKTETVDQITGARFASSYSYHHGYFDHAEREFRGFGRVDQIDTEQYEHFAKSNSSNVQERVLHQTPVLKKTWFHNGAYLDQERIINQYQSEYCDYKNPEYDHLRQFDLPSPKLPKDLTPAEWREALRACKGMALRTETYGLDGTEKQDKPFSITYNTCQIKRIQERADNHYAVFQVLNTESISLAVDRNPADPRVSHTMLLETNAYGQPKLSAMVNYGRHPEAQNSGLPLHLKQAQIKTHCVISEVQYTDDQFGILGQHNHEDFHAVLRSPVPWKNSSYQYGINNWQWSQGAYKPEQLLTDFKSVPPNHYVDYLRRINDQDVADVETNEVRLLSCSQTQFANATLNGHLANGQQSPLGISWSSYQLAFTPTLIQRIYGDKVNTESFTGDYIDLNEDGNWWVGSGHAIYHQADESQTPRERFFTPLGVRDSFGAASWTALDSYWMLPISSSVSRVGYDSENTSLLKLNESIAINDYRTLSPKYTRDANDNWSAVEVDALGVVTKSAVMGKVAGSNQDNPPADNASSEGDNLNNPSAEMHYGFYDEANNQPAWIKSKTYTQHFSKQQTPREQLTSRLDFVEQYEYSDGSGNIVMVKAQTTPGIAKQLQDDGRVVDIDTRTSSSTNRWIGNGRTIVNNKGNPVKQYEPYFSVTHEFESATMLVETGITPILFYDAAGRNVCKLNPNKTYEKVVFNAWQQQSWDVNDTLYLPQADGSKLSDITQDPDVGHFFAELDSTDISPSWYASRINSADSQQKAAAKQTELHVATPAVSHSDALGRTIYTLAHNRYEDKHGKVIDEQYETTTDLDVEGNMLSVTDARGNKVMQYRYNMLPPPDEENPKPSLYQNSMDGGEKWAFSDAQGKALLSWDNRNHLFESVYDSLHRPAHTILSDNDGQKKISLINYVDSDHADASTLKQNNLIGSAITTYDQAGRSQVIRSDFKGNLLEATRTLVSDYKNTIDWNVGLDDQLEDEVFTSLSDYDALNRITRATSPHHSGIQASVTKPSYNEAGALNNMLAAIHSSEDNDFDTYVESIEHDAKGQRQRIEYGNGVVTTYEYEPDTYRLSQLLTKDQNGKRLQDLSYSYDPTGNIIEIRDNAQSTVFFNNAVVEAHRHYTYDALNRLNSATGREHASQATIPDPNNGFSALQPTNDLALQNYIQSYEYDSVGNIKQMAHRRPNDNNSGWTRHYQYAEDSNRLLATTLGNSDLPFDENYSYNVHGSMTSMPHLPAMDWDYAEQLRHVDLQGGGDAYYVYDASGERTRKVIETNGATVKDRIYLGGWEIYRERNANETTLQRESLHVMDDKQRIALVETKSIGENDAEGLQPVKRYQMGNHLGSVNLELNGTGELISYEEFHPYGTTAYHAGNALVKISKKRYRYTGKERDEETGFSYHSARYLCCWLGRWCSADPSGLEDGLNLFIYVDDNPIEYIDLTGEGKARAFATVVRTSSELAKELATNGWKVGKRRVRNLAFKGKDATTQMLRDRPRPNKSPSFVAKLQEVDRVYPGLKVPFDEVGVPRFSKATHEGTGIDQIVWDEIDIGAFQGKKKASSELDDAWDILQEKHNFSDDEIAQLKTEYTPHHTSEIDKGTIEFVDKRVHEAFQHTGGTSISEHYRQLAGALLVGFGAALLPETALAMEADFDANPVESTANLVAALTVDLVLLLSPLGDIKDLYDVLVFLSSDEGQEFMAHAFDEGFKWTTDPTRRAPDGTRIDPDTKQLTMGPGPKW